ncbi:MAG TPA: flippase-like domain-containing protein [bacterium]|nr:flippase-like domain-containing protein [bacterium]
MFRNAHELGGIAVYARELLDHLLEIDPHNTYFVFLGSRDSLGTYAQHPRVREVYVPCLSKFLWDQAQVAAEAKKLNIDVMFSPKMSSPLFFQGRKVFAIHGAEQFVFAKEYPLLDRLYVRAFLPLYAKSSRRVIAMSESTKSDLIEPLGIPPERIAVIYHGIKEALQRRVPEDEKRAVREKFGLPESFILHVGLVWGAKNFAIFPQVLERINREHPMVLAHAGGNRPGHLRKGAAKTNSIRELGFVTEDDLAALYQSAVALVFPSLYEGFGIPLLEAMASGCPVVSTNWGAMKEVCGDAALLVDSRNPDEIANAVKRILTEPALREDLINKGYARARNFSWEKTARETLDVLVGVTEQNGHAPVQAPIAASSPEKSTPSAESRTGARGAKKGRVGDLLKIGVSLSLLAFLITRVDMAAVGAELRNMRLDFFFVAFLLNHADRFLQAGKWWALVRSSGVRFSFMQAVANTYSGNFAGQFLPAGVGGDVVRVMLLHQMRLPAIEVAASIVVERLLGLFAIVIVASLAISGGRHAGMDLPPNTANFMAILLVVMSLGLVLSFTSQAEKIFGSVIRSMNALPIRLRFLSKIQDLFLAYRRYASRHNTLLLYFLLSILEVLLVIVVHFMVCRALHIPIGFLPLMVIVPATLIMQRIPISMNGIGVQEGMLSWFFMHAGYGLDTGLSLSIALRILELGILIPGGIFLWRHRRVPPSAEPIPTSVPPTPTSPR